MSYIDKTLGTNEKVLYRAHIHSLFYARIWAFFIILAATTGWLNYQGRIGTSLALILLALSASFCLRLIVPLWTLEIALTDLRIVIKRGLITRFTHELELRTIEEVNLRQSLLGQLLNYGTLDVRGIGNVDNLVFKDVSDPLRFRKGIASAMERLSENHGEAAIAVQPVQQITSPDRPLQSHVES